MKSNRRLITMTLILGAILVVSPAVATDFSGPLHDDPVGAPMRIRDFTLPSYALLNFAPQPAAPLGKGKWAIEAQYSVVNNFQVSAAVEEYLAATRGGTRRRLDAADRNFILGLPAGQGFYIDGEFQFAELMVHYGITDRFDIGVGVLLIEFAGGDLDGTIFDFHNSFGYGQQGRSFVRDHEFQIVIGRDGDGLAIVDGPPAGGASDPSLYFRYYLGSKGRWQFNLGGGVKIPFSDDDSDLLTSGGLDVGLMLTAQARLRKSAFLFNLSVVQAEEFAQSEVDPPLLPSLTISWILPLGSRGKTRVSLQGFAAEHAFSDLFDSAISELEVQMTLAVKRATPIGVFGLGLTENLLAYDNTPDIGLHFSWGYLSK